jgi:pimeloyl-ACP methyl ester carboxylesterase
MTEVLPYAVEDPPTVRGQSFYLAIKPDPVFAVLHLPEESSRSSTGVVLCPPFGWDELSAHRGLRAWAGALTEAGYPALRFDFPGCGDSGGSPRDPGRLEAWTGAVEAAAESLRGSEGCRRVVAIGIGLGGMVAYRAAALGASIDDLVLWGVPARGRTLLRELQAFALILGAETVHTSAKDAPAAPDDSVVLGEGAINAAGFVLTAETVAELEALNLTELPVPAGLGRRILLLRRDSAEVDRRLREHLERSGAAVEVSDGPGYGTLMVDPQFAKAPQETFARAMSWLAEPANAEPAAGSEERRAHVSIARTATMELDVGDVRVRESPFEFEHEGEWLSGVLTERLPGGDGEQLCAVLLNAGAVRRIGHHRMWVEVARRWAASGVPTLRLDVVGVGDSDGAEGLYTPRTSFQRHEFATQVVGAFDELEARGLPGRFIVGGLCSGAYWGLHAALDDDRVSGLLLVNLLAFYWSDSYGAMRDARRTRALLRERDLGTIARIVATDRWRMLRMARVMAGRITAGGHRDLGEKRSDGDIVPVLERLRERDVETLLLLSHGEPLYDDFVAYGLLDRLGEWPNLHLDRIPTPEHVFRSAWAQMYIHEALDDALARTVAEENRRLAAG